MKVEIPEQLNSDAPRAWWKKLLPALFGASVSTFAVVFGVCLHRYV